MQNIITAILRVRYIYRYVGNVKEQFIPSVTRCLTKASAYGPFAKYKQIFHQLNSI